MPLIPGGDLYYTTLALVQGDTAGFARYGTLFIEEAGAMAFGVILVACLVQTLGKLCCCTAQENKGNTAMRYCLSLSKNIILIFTLRAAARIK